MGHCIDCGGWRVASLAGFGAEAWKRGIALGGAGGYIFGIPLTSGRRGTWLEDDALKTAKSLVATTKAIEGEAKSLVATTKAIEAEANSLLGVLKDGLNILRDLVLLALFVLLVCSPNNFKAMLKRAGITEFDGGFFKWQQQAVADAADQSKKAVQENSTASATLTKVQSTLDSIANSSPNAEIKKQAQDASQQVGKSLASLTTAGDSLNHSLIAQQAVLQSGGQNGQGSSIPTASQGWIYLGKVDSSKSNWVNPPAPGTTAASPKLTKGEVVTLDKDLALRDNKAEGQTFNQAQVLAAVPNGSQVTVLDFDYSNALGGGYFLWARVVVTGSK